MICSFWGVAVIVIVSNFVSSVTGYNMDKS